MKTTTRSLRALKGVRPIVCLTAYDAVTARIADQGGAVKPRDRFTGGSGIYPEPIYGAIKAIDPITGDLKAATLNTRAQAIVNAERAGIVRAGLETVIFCADSQLSPRAQCAQAGGVAFR